MPMMGYGARRGVAAAQHDPLWARAVFLERTGRLLLVECDLCLLSVAQCDELRGRIAGRTGLAPAEILIGCIHTHSAPDTGLAATLAGGELPPYSSRLHEAIERAAVDAHAAAASARLGVGQCEVAIGRNRRLANAPIDVTTPVVRIDRSDGAPLAVLYLHACHPTALGHDNLLLSADWPAAAAREIESRLPGALAIFALAAHADVDPRTRGLLDLAIPDQSVGVSFAETEALGREVGEAVAQCAEAIETVSDAEVAASSRRIDLPVHGGGGSGADYEAHVAALRSDALAALDLPADATVRTAELYGLEQERTRGLPDDERRARLARVRVYLRDRTARRIVGGLSAQVEAQVLRIGPLALLALPLEICVDVGLAWRECAPAPFASVVSIANGWLRYLPHPQNFAEPHATEHYEILQSTLAPEAATRLVEVGVDLARETQSA